MPFGYFQFVRLAAFVGFGVLAYNSQSNDTKIELILYVALAILFQPFYKIYLGRTIWNIIDVVLGLGLLISLAKPTKKD